jgi:hypothetical protein
MATTLASPHDLQANGRSHAACGRGCVPVISRGSSHCVRRCSGTLLLTNIILTCILHDAIMGSNSPELLVPARLLRTTCQGFPRLRNPQVGANVPRCCRQRSYRCPTKPVSSDCQWLARRIEATRSRWHSIRVSPWSSPASPGVGGGSRNTVNHFRTVAPRAPTGHTVPRTLRRQSRLALLSGRLLCGRPEVGGVGAGLDDGGYVGRVDVMPLSDASTWP